MKIHFSPAEQKIVDILRDGEWHCVFSEVLMKDDRRRITDINRKLNKRGYKVQSMECDGRCGTQHASRIVMRRIMKTPPNALEMTMEEMVSWNKQAVEEFDRA